MGGCSWDSEESSLRRWEQRERSALLTWTWTVYHGVLDPLLNIAGHVACASFAVIDSLMGASQRRAWVLVCGDVCVWYCRNFLRVTWPHPPRGPTWPGARWTMLCVDRGVWSIVKVVGLRERERERERSTYVSGPVARTAASARDGARHSVV